MALAEKETAAHFENQEMDTKSDNVLQTGDYSGAVAKDDPVEKALVRKLDKRIMPTLWCMYFMNYVSQSRAELPGVLLIPIFL